MDLAFKKEVFAACRQWLTERVDSLEEEIEQTRLAASEETKSSMGDKYETGRAMLHLTRERLESQLAEAQRLYNAISKLEPTTSHGKAQLGSLVATDRGLFYLSVGIGKINVDNQAIFCISTSAPLGRVLMGRNTNESFTFQEKPLLIKAVV
ncbi:MAG: 3-oxoacyl-ACP synthase [Cyclobacteriaceae bacterium]